MYSLQNANIWGHIFTGVFFWLVGTVALLSMAHRLKKHWSRFAWQLLAVFVGALGFAFNESTLWSTGRVSWYESFSYTHVLQHKLAALGISCAGLVELLRSADFLRGRAWSSVFVGVSAMVGALLLFHPAHSGPTLPGGLQEHQHAMVDAATLNGEALIRLQHRLMAVVCFLIALSAFLKEYGPFSKRLMGFAWPILVLLLGTLLIFYRE